MTTTLIGQAPYVAVSPTITLNGLANGTVAKSSAIAVPTTPGGNYYTRARVEINLGAATAVGTGTGPYNLQAVLFGSAAGTTVVPPDGVSNGQIYPITGSRIGGNTIPSTSTQLLVIDDLPVDPMADVFLAVLNNLGVALPASGVTCTVYFTTDSAG